MPAMPDLRDEPAAHLPGSDQPDPDRLPGRPLPLQEVYEMVTAAVERARAGRGPTLVEN